MRLLMFVLLFAALAAAVWGGSLLLEPEGTPPPGSSGETGDAFKRDPGPPGKKHF